MALRVLSVLSWPEITLLECNNKYKIDYCMKATLSLMPLPIHYLIIHKITFLAISSRMLSNSEPHNVLPLVNPFISLSIPPFIFFAVFAVFFFITGLAHSHETWVAVYPFLLTFKCKFLHHCPFQNAVFTHFTTPRRIFVFNISYTLLHSIVSADKF